MNNKIYYTVEKLLESDGQVKYTVGLKEISLYVIKNNDLLKIGELKCKADDLGNYFYNSEEEISDYIDEFLPEYDTNKTEFIRL